MTFKFHDGAAENSELQKGATSGNNDDTAPPYSGDNSNEIKPLAGAKMSPTDLDKSKTEAAHPTSVPNSPVKEDSPRKESHSNKKNSY